MTSAILKHTESIRFILAGNSTFTVLNTKTQKRFTFKVKAARNSTIEKPLFFVKVLTNPEIYQFIGSIFSKTFKYSQKSKISSEAQSVAVFQYIFTKLLDGTLDSCVEIWHEGRCGRCGRQLTVPDSIVNGIGPECGKMMNLSSIRQRKINKILE